LAQKLAKFVTEIHEKPCSVPWQRDRADLRAVLRRDACVVLDARELSSWIDLAKGSHIDSSLGEHFLHAFDIRDFDLVVAVYHAVRLDAVTIDNFDAPLPIDGLHGAGHFRFSLGGPGCVKVGLRHVAVGP
jgi:hypothetical protein